MISDGDSPQPRKPGKPKSGAKAPKAPGNLVPFVKSPTASAKPPASEPQKFGAGCPVPLAVKLAVRSFYVVQGMKPAQIAPMVGMNAEQVSNLARREGWVKLRANQQGEKERKSAEAQDTRAQDDVARIVEAVAIRGEELSVQTLDHCSRILNRKTEDGNPAIDSKELQMASGAAVNFVKIARMSRGLDARGAGDTRPNQINVGLFIVSGEARPMKPAIPCEAKPIPASQ